MTVRRATWLVQVWLKKPLEAHESFRFHGSKNCGVTKRHIFFFFQNFVSLCLALQCGLMLVLLDWRFVRGCWLAWTRL
jgi:hypothetical protein